jgi:ferredoxin-thioredoxin reductase catalytic subunit
MTPEKLFEVLGNFAEKQGFELNSDKEHVMMLMEGLLSNEARYGYRSCPCRLAKNDKDADKDIICPCDYREPDVEEFGSCYCGLYVSNDWNSGKLEKVRVPERRPMEMR